MNTLMAQREKQNKKMIHISVGMLSAVGCLLMVLFPAMTLESAKRGIQLWASCVLPALLPFFICANFMIALGIPGLFGRCFEKTFRRLFRVPGIGAFVFFMSITSGYPMGAKLIGDLCREGKISSEDARRMLSFCTTTGPLFVLGTVGATMLHSPIMGTIIAISHYGGAAANGIIFSFFGKKQECCMKLKNSGKASFYKSVSWGGAGAASFLSEFTEAILSSIRTLAIICGYLVVFCLITDFIEASALLDKISSPLCRSLIKGSIEMTLGCSEIAGLTTVSDAVKCGCCAFLISFGGCSVLFQSMSMLHGTVIGVKDYAVRKVCHGLLSGAAAYLLAQCIGPSVCTAGAFPKNAGSVELQLTSMYQFVFSIKMIVLTCCVMALLILINEWWMGRDAKKRQQEEVQ